MSLLLYFFNAAIYDFYYISSLPQIITFIILSPQFITFIIFPYRHNLSRLLYFFIATIYHFYYISFLPQFITFIIFFYRRNLSLLFLSVICQINSRISPKSCMHNKFLSVIHVHPDLADIARFADLSQIEILSPSIFIENTVVSGLGKAVELHINEY